MRVGVFAVVHLGHLTRATALTNADLDRLPEIMAEPRAVLFETQKRGSTLLYVFDPIEDTRKGKIAVRVNFARRKGATNAVRTAGYVDSGNLRESRYTIIEGSVD